MRTLRLSLAGTAILVLLGGLGGAVVAQSEESDTMAFPTGTLVANEVLHVWVEFDEDGTCGWHEYSRDVPCIYAVRGDLFTEMAFEWPSGVQAPGTYYWDYDGERLAFEVWGEDPNWRRYNKLSNHTFRPVPDPREVVVAIRDIAAGDPVRQRWTTLSIVSAAEAGSDALTYVPDVFGGVAAVPISMGQPITPGLLEPMPE